MNELAEHCEFGGSRDENIRDRIVVGILDKEVTRKLQWAVELRVGSTPVDFKIDTGADVSVICDETYHSLIPKRPLEPADLPLDSPGGELQCIGQFQSTVTYKGKTHPLRAYVIHGRTVNNLLSRPLSVKMNLVRRVNETVCDRGHPQAYGEHGTLTTEPVRILLKDNAQPYAVYTARRVPLPMLQKVKEELQRMERNGIRNDTAHRLVCTHGASLEEEHR